MAVSIKTELDPWMDENSVRYTLKISRAQCAHVVLFSIILFSVSVHLEVVPVLQNHSVQRWKPHWFTTWLY